MSDSLPITCRLLLQGPGTPSWNMAADEALLRLVREPILRIYGWDRPAVSIGYFDPWRVVPAGRPFVRRFTGGGLVDHARDLTYSLIVSREHPLNQAGPQESYCQVHRAVARALAACGWNAGVTEQPLQALGNACFQKPVKFDVVQGEIKLAGAAQRRTREGCLHQGSILLPEDPNRPALVSALIAELTPLLAASHLRDDMTSLEQTKATELDAERYATRAWNCSR